MNIANNHHQEIKELDVNEFLVNCEFTYWENEFKDNEYVWPHLESVRNFFGKSFGRREVVDFYKTDAHIQAKFLASMVWGHEAPENSKRDTRGPFKVREMFSSPKFSTTVINVGVDTYEEISSSYVSIKKDIRRCGPSFLTKHLYFLGKSKNTDKYPIIFDNRAAIGLVKINLSCIECLNFTSIQAATKVDAYIDFLRFVENQSSLIGCDLDQIEYFLFKYAEKSA